MHTGDLAVMHKQATYGVGDIIAYRIPAGEPGAGGQIIHRIVGGSTATGYITQGDNNPYRDVWHPKPQDVIGKRWFLVPKAERLLLALRTPWLIALLAGGLAVWVALGIGKRKARESEQ